MEFGKFTIFQWNGKDLFLHAADDRFTLLSYCEITSELHEHLKPGRGLEIVPESKEIPVQHNNPPDVYKITAVSAINFRLMEFEDDEAISAVTKVFILQSEDGQSGFMFQHNIRPAVAPHVTAGKEVEISIDGKFKILGLDARKPGTYLTLSWSANEGALTAPGELITVSQKELTPEMLGQLYPGHQVEITNSGQIRKTAAERQRHTQILAQIAGLEASGTLPLYAQHKLEQLRIELRGHEPYDPSAVTAEQKRANNSVVQKDFKLNKARE